MTKPPSRWERVIVFWGLLLTLTVFWWAVFKGIEFIAGKHHAGIF